MTSLVSNNTSIELSTKYAERNIKKGKKTKKGMDLKFVESNLWVGNFSLYVTGNTSQRSQANHLVRTYGIQ